MIDWFHPGWWLFLFFFALSWTQGWGVLLPRQPAAWNAMLAAFVVFLGPLA
jgi:hypothetical protein